MVGAYRARRIVIFYMRERSKKVTILRALYALIGSEVGFPPVERPINGAGSPGRRAGLRAARPRSPHRCAPGSRKMIGHQPCERIGGGGIYRRLRGLHRRVGGRRLCIRSYVYRPHDPLVLRHCDRRESSGIGDNTGAPHKLDIRDVPCGTPPLYYYFPPPSDHDIKSHVMSPSIRGRDSTADAVIVKVPALVIPPDHVIFA